jgi:hypothetical protein
VLNGIILLEVGNDSFVAHSSDLIDELGGLLQLIHHRLFHPVQAIEHLVLSPVLSKLFADKIQFVLPPVHDRVGLDLVSGSYRILPFRFYYRRPLSVVTISRTGIGLSAFIESPGRLTHLDIVELLLESYLLVRQIIVYTLAFPLLLVLYHQLHKYLLILAAECRSHRLRTGPQLPRALEFLSSPPLSVQFTQHGRLFPLKMRHPVPQQIDISLLI